MERVLVVDDDPDFCRFVEVMLRGCGFEAKSTATAEAGLDALASEDYAVVLADVHLGGASGIELCARIAERWENIPVVVMTAQGTLDTAIAAIRAGAYDFVTKPPDRHALELALGRAVRHQQMASEVQRLRREVGAQSFENLIGASAAMTRVFNLVERAASAEASVLVTGESGTGKELIARALHRLSPRRDGPFIALSCAAVPEALLESELFGHAKGAFTDARTTRAGLLAQASRGTLFLDEIGDMPLVLQPKLLRALQERRYRPVGSNEEITFDARVVAATNVDVEAAVRERTFREDLYFRINVVRIHMPPLRARGGDVLLLAQHLLLRYAKMNNKNVRGMSPSAAARIEVYAWPGNVRELSNCMEHAVALTQGEEIAVMDLPEVVRDWQPSGVSDAAGVPLDLVSLEEMQRGYILKVLSAVGGNKTLAAKVLGLDRKTLYRHLHRFQS